MIIFTVVYGDEYLDYLGRGLARSLGSPRNREAITGARWIVACTRAQDKPRVAAAVGDLPVHLEFMDAGSLYEGLKRAAAEAVRCGESLLLAPPDNVFSDGSIASFMRVASKKDACVATAHVRVVPSFLEGFPRDAPGMVSHAWAHLHDSWRHSEVGHGDSMTWDGGVCWQRVAPDLVTVQHHLPTVFLANFTPYDVEFFNRNSIWGVWDSSFPEDCLVKQERYRIIGSSDAAFVVEVTHPGRNVPQRLAVKPDDYDAFKGRNNYHRLNRSFVSVFRMT